MKLAYIDEVGFSLALPPTYSWSKRGRQHRLRVPTRWGSQGRVNAIGVLWFAQQALSCRLVSKNVTSEEVIAFLDPIAAGCSPESLTVVVLDNAGFHKSKRVPRRPLWETQGLFLRFLPPYCPFLNPIEGVWKHLKVFLLPRRCYPSVAELRRAVAAALSVLGAVEL